MTQQVQITEQAPEVAELPAINGVVEAALMTWRLPERVKRLVLPSYRYTMLDLEHLGFALARDPQGRVVAVAAWEPAEPGEAPDGRSALLLHGLFVHPQYQNRGLGRRLLERALQAAAAAGADGLLVRAQRDAEGFFEARGFTRIDSNGDPHAYAGRYWRAV